MSICPIAVIDLSEVCDMEGVTLDCPKRGFGAMAMES